MHSRSAGPAKTRFGLHATLELLAGLTMIIGRRRAAEAVVALAELKPGEHVIDIGCGPGVATRTAARHGASAAGIDPSLAMRRLAEHLTPRSLRNAISYREGTADSPGVPDESADVAWALASAHHWPDLDAGLRALERLLKPGGRLVIWERVATDRGIHGHHGFTNAQADDLRRRLDYLGFTNTRRIEQQLGRTIYIAVLATKAASEDRSCSQPR